MKVLWLFDWSTTSNPFFMSQLWHPHQTSTQIKFIYKLESWSHKPLGHIRLIYCSTVPVLEGCGLIWTTWIWTTETTKNHSSCWSFTGLLLLFLSQTAFCCQKALCSASAGFSKWNIKLYFYFSNQFDLIYPLPHLHPPFNNTYCLKQIHQR